MDSLTYSLEFKNCSDHARFFSIFSIATEFAARTCALRSSRMFLHFSLYVLRLVPKRHKGIWHSTYKTANWTSAISSSICFMLSFIWPCFFFEIFFDFNWVSACAICCKVSTTVKTKLIRDTADCTHLSNLNDSRISFKPVLNLSFKNRKLFVQSLISFSSLRGGGCFSNKTKSVIISCQRSHENYPLRS